VDVTENPETEAHHHRARAEASVWIVRLHGGQRSPELEAGFHRWLKSHPDNTAEFERVTAVWDAAPHASTAGLPRVTQWQQPRRRSHSWAIAAALLLTVVAGTLLASYLTHDPEYVTAVGEQRTVPLDDGSRIALNSNSKIKIEYTQKRRGVRLLQGEAFFEVAHNQIRPFIVIAGGSQVTAVGTAFEVRYEPDHIDVTLVEGKINVTTADSVASSSNPQGPNAAAATTNGYVMTAGERLRIVKGSPTKRDSPRLDAVTAWRRGEVMLDDTPLSDAVTEMNRYNKSALVIDESQIANLHVSGIYRTGDSESFAQTVAQLYGLSVSQNGGQIHLRSVALPTP
jgi:transmembrane sensor